MYFLDKHNNVLCVQVMFVRYTLGSQRVEEKGAGTKKMLKDFVLLSFAPHGIFFFPFQVRLKNHYSKTHQESLGHLMLQIILQLYSVKG